MDGGPFRAPRSGESERRVPGRQEPTQWQPQAPQQVSQSEAAPEPQPVAVEEPRPAVHRATPSRQAAKEKKAPKRKRFLIPLIIAVVVIILGVVAWSAFANKQNSATAIETDKYQAVFFTNGQVYFGKLQSFNKDYWKITDIYYLQTQTTDSSKNPQQTSTDQSNVQLVKLGQEVHGPEDEMITLKTQVLFYENLKPDGKVALSIAKYKSAH